MTQKNQSAQKNQKIQKNKNIQRAHALLGAYWLWNVLTKKNISGATGRVLQVEGNSLRKEFSERRRNGDGQQRAAGEAVKKGALNILAVTVLRKAVRKVLKDQKVF